MAKQKTSTLFADPIVEPQQGTGLFDTPVEAVQGTGLFDAPVIQPVQPIQQSLEQGPTPGVLDMIRRQLERPGNRAALRFFGENPDDLNFDPDREFTMAEIMHDRFFDGITFGLGKAAARGAGLVTEREPSSFAQVVAGEAAGLGGFIAGPYALARWLLKPLGLGSRITAGAAGPTDKARVFNKIMNSSVETGATLGLAAGMADVPEQFVDGETLSQDIMDVGVTTATAGVMGVIFPLSSLSGGGKVRQVATAMAAIDATKGLIPELFGQEGTGFTSVDDFYAQYQHGGPGSKEFQERAASYLFDMVFLMKQPTGGKLRKQLQLEDITRLDALVEEIGQVNIRPEALDVSRKAPAFEAPRPRDLQEVLSRPSKELSSPTLEELLVLSKKRAEAKEELAFLDENTLSDRLVIAKRSDQDNLVDALGVEGAKEYKKLSNQSESNNLSIADKASDTLAELESRFNVRENRLIFGIGEKAPSVEDIRLVLRARQKVTGNTAEDLARDMAEFINDLPRIDARAALNKAVELINKNSINRVELGRALERNIRSKFRDLDDADLMLNSALKKLKDAEADISKFTSQQKNIGVSASELLFEQPGDVDFRPKMSAKKRKAPAARHVDDTVVPKTHGDPKSFVDAQRLNAVEIAVTDAANPVEAADAAVVADGKSVIARMREGKQNPGKSVVSRARDITASLFSRTSAAQLPLSSIAKEGTPEAQLALDNLNRMSTVHSAADRHSAEAIRNIYGPARNRAEEIAIDEFIQATGELDILNRQASAGIAHKTPLGLSRAAAMVKDVNYRAQQLLEPDAIRILEGANRWKIEMDKFLDFAKDNGMLNEDPGGAYDRIKNSVKFYTRREYLDLFDPAFNGEPSMSPQQYIRRLDEGSIADFEVNGREIIRSMSGQAYKNVMKNRADASLARTADVLPGEGLFMRAKRSFNRTTRKLEFPDNPPKGFEELVFFENGKLEKMYIHQEFAKGWNEQRSGQTQGVMNFLSIVSGARPLKAIATGVLNPAFFVADYMVNVPFAALYSGEYSPILPIATAQIAKDMSSTFVDALTRGPKTKVYEDNGGTFDMMAHESRLGVSELARKILGPDAAIPKGMDALAEASQWMNKTAELNTRLAVTERAMRNGASPDRAVMIARDMLDFSQGGNLTKVLENFMPYTNVAAQAFRAVGRHHAKNPRDAIMQDAQIFALAAGLRAFAQYQFPDSIDDLAAGKRVTDWNIPTSLGWEDEEGKHNVFFTIRKDQPTRGLATMGELAVDAMLGLPATEVNRLEFNQAMQDTVSFVPGVGRNVFIPPTVDMMLKYSNNFDTFWSDMVNRGGKLEDDPTFEVTRQFIEDHPAVVNAVDKINERTGVKVSPKRLLAVMRTFAADDSFLAWVTGAALDPRQDIRGLRRRELPSKGKVHLLEMLDRSPGLGKLITITGEEPNVRAEMTKVERKEELVMAKQRLQFEILARNIENEPVQISHVDDMNSFLVGLPSETLQSYIKHYEDTMLPEIVPSWQLEVIRILKTPAGKAEAITVLFDRMQRTPERQARLIEALVINNLVGANVLKNLAEQGRTDVLSALNPGSVQPR